MNKSLANIVASQSDSMVRLDIRQDDSIYSVWYGEGYILAVSGGTDLLIDNEGASLDQIIAIYNESRTFAAPPTPAAANSHEIISFVTENIPFMEYLIQD